MKVIQVPTSSGIDDIKLIGENELERAFIKQLAEAGTLSSISRAVADSVTFRPISNSSTSTGSSYYSSGRIIGKYDFTLRQNENRLIDLTFNSEGTPVDLAAFSAIRLQVKARASSASPIFELAIGSGLTIGGDDGNVLGVSFSAAQTKLLTFENYYYDVLMSTPTSNVYYLEGKITVKKSVTQ